MAERSKALDLSPNIARCVGSNPTGTNFFSSIVFFLFCIFVIDYFPLIYSFSIDTNGEDK